MNGPMKRLEGFCMELNSALGLSQGTGYYVVLEAGGLITINYQAGVKLERAERLADTHSLVFAVGFIEGIATARGQHELAVVLGRDLL